VLRAARWKYRSQKSPKSRHLGIIAHRTNLSGYIFATKSRIDNLKKLIKQQCLPRYHNMVNFGLLAAEICWRV